MQMRNRYKSGRKKDVHVLRKTFGCFREKTYTFFRKAVRAFGDLLQFS